MALQHKANQLLDQAREQNKTLLNFRAGHDSLSTLRDQLGTQTMFGQPRWWKVTDLIKMRSRRDRQTIVELFSNSPEDVMVVVNGELTTAQKKLFTKNWQLQEFKLPKVFFQFTEAIGVQPLHQVHQLLQQSLQQKNEWELHALLARQFRLLLATKTGAPVKAPPFTKPKLKKQASKLELQQIINALHTLFATETAIKTGQNHLSWEQQIDRLLVKIYDE